MTFDWDWRWASGEAALVGSKTSPMPRYLEHIAISIGIAEEYGGLRLLTWPNTISRVFLREEEFAARGLKFVEKRPGHAIPQGQTATRPAHRPLAKASLA